MNEGASNALRENEARKTRRGQQHVVEAGGGRCRRWRGLGIGMAAFTATAVVIVMALVGTAAASDEEGTYVQRHYQLIWMCQGIFLNRVALENAFKFQTIIHTSLFCCICIALMRVAEAA